MFISLKLSNYDSPAVQGFSQNFRGALILQYKNPYCNYDLFLNISKSLYSL